MDQSKLCNKNSQKIPNKNCTIYNSLFHPLAYQVTVRFLVNLCRRSYKIDSQTLIRDTTPSVVDTLHDLQ